MVGPSDSCRFVVVWFVFVRGACTAVEEGRPATTRTGSALEITRRSTRPRRAKIRGAAVASTIFNYAMLLLMLLSVS